MKRVLRSVLIATVILTLLILGISCSATPTDKSWDNPEKFVLYDVNEYISIALNNDQELLEKEYGAELARLGKLIWEHYSFAGKKPKIVDIERFADGCWVIVSDTLIGSKGDYISDEATFYYRFHRDRWQLAFIETQFLDNKGLEIKDTTIEYNRDIEYK